MFPFKRCYEFTITTNFHLMSCVLLPIAGGAGSEGGRGKDCFKDGAFWSLRCKDTGRYTGRGPRGPPGYSGSPGTGKIKMVTLNSTMTLIEGVLPLNFSVTKNSPKTYLFQWNL